MANKKNSSKSIKRTFCGDQHATPSAKKQVTTNNTDNYTTSLRAQKISSAQCSYTSTDLNKNDDYFVIMQFQIIKKTGCCPKCGEKMKPTLLMNSH